MATPPVDALAHFHPLVQRWFRRTLGTPSPPQQAGWPAIAAGGHALILAPTGSGKTLAAFLYELDALIREGRDTPLANAVHLLYVSPLKALSNDVHRNLERPLAELAAEFQAAGEPFPEIRVAVRTGDTPASARARMVRKTPYILITTPESLHLLMMSASGRSMFSALRAVIVDEIHAVAGTKRGAHLALTLERLAEVAPAPPQRIGLSATQRPLDEIARFLGGCDVNLTSGSEPIFRPVQVIDCGLVKRMETSVISPVEDLAHVDGTIWTAVVPLVLEQIRSARTTLVFVNNRGQAEKIAAKVNAAAGEEVALPYHGSLSRERRFQLEGQLKAGELRAVVATSSLELGIDVGSVDLVVQLQSPKRVSSALQRVGRAGHSLDATSRGVFVPTFRDDALEELAIVYAMQHGDVEPTRVVQNALDVLAQLIVAMVAADSESWTADALYAFVRRAYSYHQLSRNAFDETLAMLAGRYPSDVAAELDARLFWDRATDALTPTRSARMLATISGGTIPDRGLYTVYLADKTRLGELDEEFVHESRVGDAFQLGSSTWRIRAIEHDRVIVAPAPGAPARMPFWHGDFMARSFHLSAGVGDLRRRLGAATTPEDSAQIEREYHADSATVRSLVEYIRAQRDATALVPDDRQLVLEHFRDEVGSARMVLHAPFGGRVNAPWGMALGRLMRERLGVDVQVQTTDDGIMLRLPHLAGDPPVDLFQSLLPDAAETLILDEVSGSSLFGARFRMNAARALLLPRGNPRRRMPLWLQRLKSADLLQTVREYPSFPILVETYREVVQDAFDLAGLRDVLQRVASGLLPIHQVRTALPSPFAQSLQFGFVMDWMYGDDAPRAESRVALLSLDRVLLDELLGGEGADAATLAALDALLQERRGTAPGRQARDADELSMLVDRAGDLTESELSQRVAPEAEWRRGDPVRGLLERSRLIQVEIAGEQRFILTDATANYAAAFGDGVALPTAGGELTPEAARREVLARYVALASPFTVADLVRRYRFEPTWVQARLEQWESAGRLVRGTFGGDRAVTRWCSRRALERARRRELATARAQVQPVAFAAFAAYMQRWQHLTAATRLSGAEATGVALRQLQGIARPGAGWERDYLPSRVDGYEPSALDAAAATGRIVWAADRTLSGGSRSPAIRFFERGTGRAWLTPLPEDLTVSESARQVWDALIANGASFTDDLGAITSLATNRLRDALRELVSTGVITNDSIGGMRDVIRWVPTFPVVPEDAPDPARWLPDTFVVQRRVNVRRLAKWRRPDLPGAPTWGGRWSLVRTPGVLGPERDEEALGEIVARQWLARYGVVSRDWWRRERPPVGWRTIYRELKRLEFRGEVRRGYFVSGLAGAQFALPDAVELLRSAAVDEIVAIAASDPANVYALPLADGVARDPLSRPRGASAELVTRAGEVMLAAERRGKRIRIRDGEGEQSDLQVETGGEDWLTRGLLGLIAKRQAAADAGRRDIVVETINGEPAVASRFVPSFLAAGFRRQPGGLRYYVGRS
jgi:ATP-dependent helicase Lhr and Lhr-like helicase